MTVDFEKYSSLSLMATYGFIFFAWIVWPVFIPFILWKIEKDKSRKKILFVFTLFGLVVASVLTLVLLTQGVKAKVEDCSIVYDYGIHYSPNWLLGVFYIMTVVVSNLVSSRRLIWLLGVVNVVTYLVSRVYFAGHLISIWCFLAAISSLIVLYIIKDEVNSLKLKENDTV